VLRALTLTALSLISMTVNAQINTAIVKHKLAGTQFESILVSPDIASSAAMRAVVMVPNWMGMDKNNLEQAKLIAARGYVVLLADVYGSKVRPKDAAEAGAAAGKLKADRTQLRARVAQALNLLQSEAKSKGITLKGTGAIGFCFGGTSVLELARSGAELAGTVSFHGGLDTPTPNDAKNIQGKVLALHGADDPYVPREQVLAFEDEMRAGNVDWQLLSFGGAVHSFTDPSANAKGQADYNERVAMRAYAAMDAFFAETMP